MKHLFFLFIFFLIAVSAFGSAPEDSVTVIRGSFKVDSAYVKTPKHKIPPPKPQKIYNVTQGAAYGPENIIGISFTWNHFNTDTSSFYYGVNAGFMFPTIIAAANIGLHAGYKLNNFFTELSLSAYGMLGVGYHVTMNPKIGVRIGRFYMKVGTSYYLTDPFGATDINDIFLDLDGHLVNFEIGYVIKLK